MPESITRVEIRAADSLTPSKVERLKQFADADTIVAKKQIEQMKMETHVTAFMCGTRPESKDYVQLERLAILTQQRDRVLEQLRRDAEQKQIRERNICVFTVVMSFLCVAAAAWFVLNVRP